MSLPHSIEAIKEEIRTLESRLDDELEKRRSELRYRIEEGEAIFEKEFLDKQRRLRKNLLRHLMEIPFSGYLVSPIIYGLIVPALILDLFVSLYHIVCFPVYGIPRVKRSDYIIIDRHRLAYLDLLEKFNCAYCGYINGLLAYVQEIAARTEQHFCPISHARKPRRFHSRYRLFFDYGDGERYKDELETLRQRFEDLEKK